MSSHDLLWTRQLLWVTQCKGSPRTFLHTMMVGQLAASYLSIILIVGNFWLYKYFVHLTELLWSFSFSLFEVVSSHTYFVYKVHIQHAWCKIHVGKTWIWKLSSQSKWCSSLPWIFIVFLVCSTIGLFQMLNTVLVENGTARILCSASRHSSLENSAIKVKNMID